VGLWVGYGDTDGMDVGSALGAPVYQAGVVICTVTKETSTTYGSAEMVMVTPKSDAASITASLKEPLLMCCVKFVANRS